jgi:alkyl hydroperoxide reductase subunit AhpC
LGLPSLRFKEVYMTARVGKPAPEFECKAFTQGEIKTIKLADYRGKWVMLYFYPGDFTFV